MKILWDKEEDDILRKFYPIEGYEGCLKRLNRTKSSIQRRACFLKVKGTYKGSPCIDLTGFKFGKMTVLCRSDKLNYEGYRDRWVCKCECGELIDVAGHYIRNRYNKRKDIDCTQIRSNDPVLSVKRRAWQVHLRTCKDKNKENFLNFHDYIEIASKPCIYCGEFSERKNRDLGFKINFNSVDRKNNEPYYKLSNSQSCCFVCQRNKGKMKHEEFVNFINKVYKFINKGFK